MNPLRMTPKTVRVAGHRGHSIGAPENTLAAFRAAHAIAGCGVTCETDLIMTRDGIPVLLHDDMLDRTTNATGLSDLCTWADLERLDAGSWFDSAFAGEPVPSLEMALRLAVEKGIIYQLKIPQRYRSAEVYDRLAEVIRRTDGAGCIQFSSFDFQMLYELKRVLPQIPTVGVSHTKWIDSVRIAREAALDALSIEFENFSSEEAGRLHDAGVAVVMGVPRPEYLEKLGRYGMDARAMAVERVRLDLVDQIQSDDVSLMVDILREANDL